ncbi:MAG: hypothetical protein LC687_00060 [Actinobacteria bacterium]|nr:hypothetical protein [Actinomycetota bacterium]
MPTIHLQAPASCSSCGFSTADLHLLANHSCDIQSFGGRCEDFPCCGHEAGDCNGLLYGSDEAIKADAMTHINCEHEHGFCDADEDEEPEDDDAEYLDSLEDAGEFFEYREDIQY